ncbi:MAG: hypothetical protein CMI29_06720 [Opitutae bacterium]|nr:hypothetical protein [Opitutae bacterium]
MTTDTKEVVHNASLLLQLSAAPQLLKQRTKSEKHARLLRCGKCYWCMRRDCGKCPTCKDKRKFGGEGKKKKACLFRQCLSPVSAK